jgi:hypothetical protein
LGIGDWDKLWLGWHCVHRWHSGWWCFRHRRDRTQGLVGGVIGGLVLRLGLALASCHRCIGYGGC